MGALTAKNIAREIRGHQRLPFHYRDYGQLATIGRNSAVAMFGAFKLSGYPAWIAWLLAASLPHQLPQPYRRDARLGVVVLDLRPLRAHRHQQQGGHLTSMTPFMLGCSPQM